MRLAGGCLSRAWLLLVGRSKFDTHEIKSLPKRTSLGGPAASPWYMNVMSTKERGVSRAGRITGIGLLVLHLGALAAFFPQMFSWTAVGVGFLMYYLTVALGVGLGYHRLLTHRSLRTPKFIEYGLTILGALAL